MTNTTAKAQLLDLLIEPLKGCKGLYAHRQNLMQRVMRMPDLDAGPFAIACSSSPRRTGLGKNPFIPASRHACRSLR